MTFAILMTCARCRHEAMLQVSYVDELPGIYDCPRCTWATIPEDMPGFTDTLVKIESFTTDNAPKRELETVLEESALVASDEA